MLRAGGAVSVRVHNPGPSAVAAAFLLQPPTLLVTGREMGEDSALLPAGFCPVPQFPLGLAQS